MMHPASEPTEAQKAAGNYRKRHMRLHGLDIAIENEKGSIRRGKDKDGKEWECRLPNHYGYIKRTEGADGDHVDCYVGPAPTVNKVFVVDQKNLEGDFDEHKCMLGFRTLEDALKCYRGAFSDGKAEDRIDTVTEFTVPQFKEWLKNHDTTVQAKKAIKKFAFGGAVKERATGGNIFDDLIPVKTQPITQAPNVSPEERDLMIRTLIGEAKGQPVAGQDAVAHVMLNRLKAGNYGKTMRDILFAKHQFEPWMTRRDELMAYSPEQPFYQSAAEVIDRALKGGNDPTGGATHFLNPDVVMQRTGRLPAWARGEGQRIGQHVFHRHGKQLPATVNSDMPDTSSFQPVSQPLIKEEEQLPPEAVPTSNDNPFAKLVPNKTDNPFADLVPEKKPEKMGRMRAFGQGMKQGAALNFNDELAGFDKASPLPEIVVPPTPMLSVPWAAARAVTGAANVAYDSLFGETDATKKYKEARDAERKLNEQAEKDRPGFNIAGNVAGSVALPFGTALKAATLPARMLQGAKVGAITGGVSGLGAGENLEDRLTQGALTAGVGTGAGALAPVAIAGLQGAGNLTKKALSPLTSRLPFRGAVDPDKLAAQNIVGTINKDIQAGTNGLSWQQWLKARDEGVPVTLADLGGTNTQALSRSVANTSPEARGLIDKTLHQRFQTQAPRFENLIDRLSPAEAQQTREALQKTADNVRAPFYKRAMDAGSKGIDDPKLLQLQTSPTFQKAMDGATKKMQDLIASGRNHGSDVWIPDAPVAPQSYKPILRPAKNFGDSPTMDWVPDAPPPTPNGKFTLEFWDQVKKSLDDQIGAAKRSGEKNAAADLTTMKNQLLNILDEQTAKIDFDKMEPHQAKLIRAAIKQDPSLESVFLNDKSVPVKSLYKEARGVARSLFQAEDALEAGENFIMKGKFKTHELKQALNKMTPEERQLMEIGSFGKLKDIIKESRDKRSITQVLDDKIDGSLSARERLELLHGPLVARQIQARLHVEEIMDRLKGAVQGNSTTARQLAELGLVGGAGTSGTIGSYNMDPQQVGYSALIAALTLGNRRVNQSLAKRTAEMLMSNDPEIITKALKIVSNNKSMMQGLAKYEQQLTRALAHNTPTVYIPAARNVAAEENEQ